MWLLMFKDSLNIKLAKKKKIIIKLNAIIGTIKTNVNQDNSLTINSTVTQKWNKKIYVFETRNFLNILF